MVGNDYEELGSIVVLHMRKEGIRDAHARGTGGRQEVVRAEESGTDTSDPQE
jgi:hypothetical protein